MQSFKAKINRWREPTHSRNKRGGPDMKRNDKEQSYIESDEEREQGHEDTRYKNFECENKTNLGCDPGVDVAG
jgi:hypothetical protein